MIHFSVPSLYAGVYGMEMLLDVAQRYHPELRRWSVLEETDEGTRILVDKQSKDIVEIPQYCFALFPGGNPVVVPYDLMSIMAPPNPRIVVPAIDTMEQKSAFSERMSTLIGNNDATKIVVDGPNNEDMYLDFPLEYLHLPSWYFHRSEDYYAGDRGRVRVVEGDTLFSYTYPRDVDTKAYIDSGGVDYMPTSVVSSALSVPALDALDLSGGMDTKDWTTLWPTPKKQPEGPFMSLKEYAKLAGIEYYVAEYRYKRGMLEGARPHARTGVPLVPKSLATKGKK